MPALIDLTGQRFGRLVVLGRDFSKKYTKPHWLCQCDCGNQTIVYGYSLKSGATQSCGCLNKEIVSAMTLKDLTGQTFGKLTVLERDMTWQGKGNHARWICQCECGNIISAHGQSLRNGQVSCGCANSIGEYKIAQLLIENNIPFEKEYSFPDLKDINLLRYDFAIFDKDNNVIRLVEFDGNQHKSDNIRYTETAHQHDIMKNHYALQNNIPLIRIPYEMRDKMTLEDILGEKFLYREG